MIRELLLRRFRYTDEEILGTLFIFDEKGNVIFNCKTLELAYRDNQRGISCVPTGDYFVVKEHSPRFDEYLWELKHVPGRAECKFHVANYFRQLNGCIALGLEHAHIDDDGYADVTSSRQTVDAFHIAMEPARQAYLTIIGRA